MASEEIFELMEAEDWNKVMELLTNTTWTSQDLEEKHGIRSSCSSCSSTSSTSSTSGIENSYCG